MYRNENAFPFVNRLAQHYEDADNRYGFSKIELAALMIAPAVMANHPLADPQEVGKLAALIAVSVLEEAIQCEKYNPE